MTSDRHLALMALMSDLEQPTKTFNRSVRLAAALESESPQWDTAVGKGKDALDLIEQAVRHWVATNKPEPIPGLCSIPSPDGLFMCRLQPHGTDVWHGDRTDEEFKATGQRMGWTTPVELPAGFERKTGVSVSCAVCGYGFDEDEFIHFFDSAEEATDTAVGTGWDELTDGRLLCETSDDKHDELRRTVGIASTTD